MNPGKKSAQKRATWHLWFKIIIACLPAAVVGILLDEVLDKYLYNPYVVAAMLIIYGVIFIAFENRNQHAEFRIKKVSQISYQTAFYIGLFQLLALIPGTSRSGRNDPRCDDAWLFQNRRIGVHLLPWNSGHVRRQSLKDPSLRPGISAMELFFMAAAMVIAFVVSMYSIQFLLGYVKKHDFKFFGYYRIVLGVIVLIYFGLTAILTK